MLIYILLCFLIILLALMFTIYVINYNKFKSIVIKINEANENINVLLREKYNLLLLLKEVMNDKGKTEVFESIENIKVNELNSFELNIELSKFDKDVIELRDFNKDVEFNEEDINKFDDLESIDIDCLASEKYYNDNASLYNKLLDSFPSNIVAKIKRYKEKELYSNQKEEMFEILKQ